MHRASSGPPPPLGAYSSPVEPSGLPVLHPAAAWRGPSLRGAACALPHHEMTPVCWELQGQGSCGMHPPARAPRALDGISQRSQSIRQRARGRSQGGSGPEPLLSLSYSACLRGRKFIFKLWVPLGTPGSHPWYSLGVRGTPLDSSKSLRTLSLCCSLGGACERRRAGTG